MEFLERRIALTGTLVAGLCGGTVLGAIAGFRCGGADIGFALGGLVGTSLARLGHAIKVGRPSCPRGPLSPPRWPVPR